MTHDPRSVARAVLGALLADDRRVTHDTARVLDWIDADPIRQGERELAWAAAHASQLALAAIDERVPAAVNRRQIEAFRALSPASQVVVALHELCGLSDEEVAEATGQPIDRVTNVLDRVGHDLDAPAPARRRRRPTNVIETSAVEVLALPDLDDPEEADTDTDTDTDSDAPAEPTDGDPAVDAPEPEPEDDAERDELPAPPPRAELDEAELAVPRRRRRAAERPTRARWWVIVAALVLALIAGGIAARSLKDDDASPEKPSSSATLGGSSSVKKSDLSPGCATAAGDAATAPTSVVVDVGDTQREYRVVAAEPLDPGVPRPLVIVLGDVAETPDAAVTASRIDQLTAALQLVAVVPRGSDGVPQWNVGGAPESADDLAFLDRVITDETTERCIDLSRIVLIGHGAGAHMAATFACARPGTVSGLVMVAGVLHPSGCQATDGLSLMTILGDADPILPLAGGTTPEFGALFAGAPNAGSEYDLPPATDSLTGWATSLGCRGTANEKLGVVTMQIDTECRGDGEIWKVVIPGAGHDWYPATYDLLVQFLTKGPIASS